jgi:hypothetical protein
VSLKALSPRINLEQSRKQAKDLVKAFKAGDPESLDRIRWNHPRFRGLTDVEIQKRAFALAAQPPPRYRCFVGDGCEKPTSERGTSIWLGLPLLTAPPCPTDDLTRASPQ